MQELLNIILGNESASAYLAAEILGLLGFLSMSAVNYYYRADLTLDWSLKKWVVENWPLTFLLVITMYVGLRWQADIVAGINTHSTKDLSFIKDKWLWFIVGGFLFRAIIHQVNRYVKKLTSDKLVN